MYVVGLLRSTGVTPFHSYYEPIRLPSRRLKPVIDSRRDLPHPAAVWAGLPVAWLFFRHASPPPTPTDPTGSPVRCSPVGVRLPLSWLVGHPVILASRSRFEFTPLGIGTRAFIVREVLPSLCLGCPDRVVSRASSPPPAVAQLDVERTILIFDTSQSNRTTTQCWCNQKNAKDTKGQNPGSNLELRKSGREDA